MKKVLFILLAIILFTANLTWADEVKTAIGKLQNKETRAEGVKELEKMGQKAVPILIEALADVETKQINKATRRDIIRILSYTKDERGILPIGNVLTKSQDKDERVTAAICLGITGNKKAIPFLKQALQDKDKTVKLRAAYALGRLGDDSGFTIAVQFTKDNEARIREQAIEAIGRIGKNEGKIYVEQAINDSDIWVRIKAKIAKRRIEVNQLSRQAKIDYLKNILENDEQYEVQKWAANELFELGEKGIVILQQVFKQGFKDENNRGAHAAYHSLKIHGIPLEYSEK